MRRRSVLALGFAALTLASLQGGATPSAGALFLSAHHWRHVDPAFGGLSGIEIAADGRGLVAIGDRGHLVRARIRREGLSIVAVDDTALHPLRAPDGTRLADGIRDAEGLARGGDGTLFVSFEGLHRVWRYATPAAAERLPDHPAFKRLPFNGGIEALAIDSLGRLVAVPERSGSLTRPFPVWRFDGKTWLQVFSLQREGGFLPVGADFGPEGRLYVLERAFNGFGFRSRVRRFIPDAGGPGRGEIVLQTSPRRHDNLEGISVWRDDHDRIRITMISDDNFLPFQRTEIVEYALPESLASSRRSP